MKRALRCPVPDQRPCAGCKEQYGEACRREHRFELLGVAGRARCPYHGVLLEPAR